MSQDDKPFLFGAVVGSGLTAKAADAAGADYLLALNAGRFRVQGASSLTSFLPVRSANSWVMEFSERELLGRCAAPLYAGLSVSDPTLDIAELIEQVKAIGFNGVCNFPSTTSISGALSHVFEREGLGFARELALVRAACDSGLDTFVYVQTNHQAREMVDAGASAICVNIGFTGGATGVSTPLTLDMAAARIDRVIDGIQEPVATLCHGGPITSPEHALALMRICRVQGFIAGSTLDRIPLEQTLQEVTQGFTAIPKLARIRDRPSGISSTLIGSSSVMQSIRHDIEQLASDTVPILVSGETGTGKSMIATHLHDASNAVTKAPVVVDCPALDEQFGGFHLLGRASGGQTRTTNVRGALERAAGSTLILEDVNSLHREHQGKLLGYLDNGLVTRIGDHQPRPASARVVSTTTQSQDTLTQSEHFRTDLYYRLAGHQISIPPLRERIDDVPELALHLAKALNNSKAPKFSNAALRVLLEHAWPGNVRELQFAVVRALRNAQGGTVQKSTVDFLIEQPTTDQTGRTRTPLEPQETERERLLEALSRNGFRRGRTAEELGITTRTLYSKIKKHGIQV